MSEPSGRRLDGKVALVTGGGGGIGRAIAERIVVEGGRVVVGDIDDAALRQVAAALGSSCMTLCLDVTTEHGAAMLADLAVTHFGRVDIAVANAGGGISVPIVDLELDQWRRVLDLTLTGTFLTIRAAARVMADGGSIVALSSLSGVQPGRGMAAYCAAKAGVMSLVDVAALELGPRAIRVNSVAPGLVRTPSTEQLWGIPGMVEAYEGNTALNRHGTPDDIASAVAFLVSDDAAYVTGTTLLVDGGAHHLSYPDTRAIRTGRS